MYLNETDVSVMCLSNVNKETVQGAVVSLNEKNSSIDGRKILVFTHYALGLVQALVNKIVYHSNIKQQMLKKNLQI